MSKVSPLSNRFAFLRDLVRRGSGSRRPPLADHPRQIVFHHQPKTAGSSFREYLMTLVREDQVCPAEIDDEITRLSDAERASFKLFGGHFRFDTLADTFPDADWIIFLRHPVDRIVSNYYNLRDSLRHPENWKQRAADRPAVKEFLDQVADMTLEDFVHSDHPRARDRVVNRQTRYLLRRQSDGPGKRIVADDPRMLEQAKHTLQSRFRFVGVQERYDLSVAVFCREFGIDEPADLRQFDRNVNELKPQERRYELTDELRTYLEQQNVMDIALWNFGLECLARRAAALGIEAPEGSRPPDAGTG